MRPISHASDSVRPKVTQISCASVTSSPTRSCHSSLVNWRRTAPRAGGRRSPTCPTPSTGPCADSAAAMTSSNRSQRRRLSRSRRERRWLPRDLTLMPSSVKERRRRIGGRVSSDCLVRSALIAIRRIRVMGASGRSIAGSQPPGAAPRDVAVRSPSHLLSLKHWRPPPTTAGSSRRPGCRSHQGAREPQEAPTAGERLGATASAAMDRRAKCHGQRTAHREDQVQGDQRCSSRSRPRLAPRICRTGSRSRRPAAPR